MERIDEPAELMGRPVEAVVERVVANRDSDPETVRKILTEISEEETVTREAIDEQLADLSKVVATPETRVEVTRRALTDAREAAAIIANTNTVRSRLETFEAELTALDERVEELGSRLSSLVTRAQAPDDLYEIAREIQELRAEAIDAQRDADSLATEIEEFEQSGGPMNCTRISTLLRIRSRISSSSPTVWSTPQTSISKKQIRHFGGPMQYFDTECRSCSSEMFGPNLMLSNRC